MHALAALYLLNIYYRHIQWTTSYTALKSADFSFGSALFAVKAPSVQEQIWYKNTPVESDSPFVVTYQDESFRRIRNMQQQERDALSDYWETQPELKVPAFQQQILLAQKREADDPRQRVMYIWKLASFRLNKKIPSDLPFEEKKEPLLDCDEWHGQMYRRNHHITADDITEENIDSVLKEVAVCKGIEIESEFQPHEWISMAMNDNICNVSLYETGSKILE